MADSVASIFTPIVLAIALGTFTGWFFLGPQPRLAHAIISSVSVLVIACPCAIGLATPMSIIVGIGRAASEGVLFKDAESLEALGQSKSLMIDKTGTITEGRPTVTDIVLFGNQSEEEILLLATAGPKSVYDRSCNGCPGATARAGRGATQVAGALCF